MYIPFVRSDLNGDMSGFSGTLNVFSTYSNSQGYSAELRINHSKGLPNALVNINTSIWTSNTAGTTVVLGALSGAGELGGNETWQIGSKGINTEFKGRITAGSLIKMGIEQLYRGDHGHGRNPPCEQQQRKRHGIGKCDRQKGRRSDRARDHRRRGDGGRGSCLTAGKRKYRL